MRVKQFVNIICVVLAGAILNSDVLAGDVADFRLDIAGVTNNPHADTSGTGTWSYWRSETVNPSDAGANLAAYVWNVGAGEFRDPAGTYGQVRQTNLHPGEGNYTVVRWQAGSNDTYLVNGFFQRQVSTADGDGVSVFVYVNGQSQQISTNSLPPITGYPKASFDFITTVNAGQFIDFVVYANTTISFDRTDFDAAIANLSPEITNGSFQDPDYTAGVMPDGGTTIPGWQKEEAAWGSPGIQLDNKGGSPPAPDGDQWCFFNLVPSQSTTGGNEGSIWQSVGYVRENYIYTTEFTLGNRSVSVPATVKASLWRGGSAPSVAGGSTLIGEQTVDPPPVSSTTTQNYQCSFESGSGFSYEKLWLRFDVSTPGGASTDNYQLLLDAVKLDASPDMSNQGTMILLQ